MSSIKNKGNYILAVLLALAIGGSAVMGGCSKAPNEQDKAVVYASVYPLYDFAKKIAGDAADIRSLIPGGTEPHDWEPSASDIISLEKADVLIINGLGMEHWVEKVSDTLDNKNLMIVETGSSLAHIELDDVEHGHTHENETYDPHVWLNPQNAMVQMKIIKDSLIAVDEKNKDTYETNYLKYAEMLNELDEQYRQGLSNIEQNTIIVSHSAFSYMCEAYGLREVSIGGVLDDSEPDPATMVGIINIIRKEGIEYIFYTDANNTKVVDTLAKEAEVKTLYLSPLENISNDDQKANLDYFSIMQRNLENLKKALTAN